MDARGEIRREKEPEQKFKGTDRDWMCVPYLCVWRDAGNALRYVSFERLEGGRIRDDAQHFLF